MSTGGAPSGQPAIVAVYVDGEADAYLPTLRSLFAHVKLPVVVAAPTLDVLELFGVFDIERLAEPSAATLVNELWSQWHSSIVLVADPVIVPDGFLDLALAALGHDVRVGTVSFFCNAAGHLSFPTGIPTERPPEGHDESSVTRRLRALVPPPAPAPIVTAVGPVTVLSATALGAVGALHDGPSRRAAGAVVDFSLRARRKGFMNVLDPGTFVTRPADLSREPVWVEAPDWSWATHNHPFAEALLVHEREAPSSPMTLATSAARTKITGLRVLIDGTCLGPTEMGTQVSILAIIDALAARDDVAEVGVALEQEAPAYASAVLSARKVVARQCPPGDLSVFGHFDVGHRPFQPHERFDIQPWRTVCDRFVVTVLDVIGYQIGSYFPNPENWLDYREGMRRTVSLSDGVTVISNDVREQVQFEQLPVDPSRLVAIPYGGEHLTGNEPARMPDELLARGYVAGEFLLCLGTNYSHKNRDLAARAFRILRERSWNLSLVLAGAFVPYGSSRLLEAFEITDEDDVFVLPDISSVERNWLFRHASLVLYPSSAEGFGLVPFEAARFGTPTVNVAFGPLAEMARDIPVTAPDWSPQSLADAAEKLLRDPALARAQVEACLAAGTEYTWARTAEALTGFYRQLVARPPRWPDGVPMPSTAFATIG